MSLEILVIMKLTHPAVLFNNVVDKLVIRLLGVYSLDYPLLDDFFKDVLEVEDEILSHIPAVYHVD